MTPETVPDNAALARQVARACHKASLATLDRTGAPYVSLVTLALDHDLSVIIYVSAMSAHTRNMTDDSRVAVLLDGTDGHPNPQTGPRLSMQGNAAKVEDAAEQARLRTRFLARNPGAAEYTTFADFALWKVAPSRAQFVGGFGRAVWLTTPFGLDPAVIQAFRTQEGQLLTKLEAQGRKDVVAVDPDGYDVAVDESWARVSFPQTATGIDQAAAWVTG